MVETYCCRFFRIISSSDDDCWREAPEDEPDPAAAPAPVAAMACSMAALNMSDVMAGLDGVGRDVELADEDVDGAIKDEDAPAPEAEAGAIPAKNFDKANVGLIVHPR